MCFQGFAQHLCEHPSLFEDECKDAAELDLPFFQKIQCPNYNTVSRNSPYYCGRGQYYCARWPDGAYLDQVHSTRQRLAERMSSMKRDYDERALSRRNQILQRLMQQHGKDRKKLEAAIASDPEMCQVRAPANIMNAQGQQVKAKMNQMEFIIQNSKQFYLLNQQHAQSIGLPEAIPRLPDSLRLDSVATPSRASGAQSSTAARRMPPLAGAISMTGGPIAGQLGRRTSLIHSQSAPALSYEAEHQPPHFDSHAAHGEVTDTPGRKGGRPFKKTREQRIADGTANVRRSARVKEKKVNYAESADSEGSRSSSPVKTEISSFSQSKSEAPMPYAAASPGRPSTLGTQQSRANRSRSSLGDMIRNWKESSLVGSPLKTQLTQKDEAHGVPEQGFGQAGAEQYRSDTPETDILPGNEKENDIPPQFNALSTPARNWIVNKGEFDPTLTPGEVRSAQRNAYGYDSSKIALAATPNSVVGRINHMLRTPSGLSPGYIQPVQYATPTNLVDPRKRTASMSSPGPMSSQKRPRLSMPGFDGTPILSINNGKKPVSASSPPTRLHAIQRSDSVEPTAQAPATPPSDNLSAQTLQQFQNPTLAMFNPFENSNQTTSDAQHMLNFELNNGGDTLMDIEYGDNGNSAWHYA